MRRRISTTGRGSGMTDDDQRYLTAIHEAGHAIAGQALGFTVHEVTVQDGPGGGTCAADVERPHGTLDAIQREAAAREALRILRERWNDVQSLAIRLNARARSTSGRRFARPGCARRSRGSRYLWPRGGQGSARADDVRGETTAHS